MPELDWNKLRKHPECLQLPATHQHVPTGQNQSFLALSMPQQVSHAWSGLGKHPECLQLPATHQHVPKWPKSIMFDQQHAPAGQSCLIWDKQRYRVLPGACYTPTFANMAKNNHVWPAACPSRSVMPEVGSESTQSASSCLPHTNMCQHGQNQSGLVTRGWSRPVGNGILPLGSGRDPFPFLTKWLGQESGSAM
jgi:hypothetical protein